jgi:hypothetical protein
MIQHIQKNGKQINKNAVTSRGDEEEKKFIAPTTPKGD